LCTDCRQNIILMIDEADKSSDNQIFLSFLGLLREKYLDQMKGRDKTFHSVILAGVYDVKNLKLKLHPDIEPKYYSYESENHRIHIGKMFGFLKDEQGIVSISNRIFEMKLYNLLISENETDSRIFTAADMEKNQFIKDGTLHMELVIQKFCEYFEEIYADADDRSIEDNGRRIFLIFLKPIINGSGNYYIESRTRNLKRTDIIIDYKGTQNIISFNFNKNKQTGIRRMMFQDRL